MHKDTLHYLPLEPYKARYTELLSAEDGWAERAFKPLFNVNRIEPDDKNSSVTIQSGRVLDSVNRPVYALGQIKKLLETATNGPVFLEDMFHPGIEALPYTGRSYLLYTYCWAQSFDKYDFTRPMVHWMRPYEHMVAGIVRKIFVASPILQDLMTTALCCDDEKVVYVGLPFDSKRVAELFDPSFLPGPFGLVYSSRFDTEKRPNFFLDVVESMPHVKAVICTGHSELKGNDYAAVARAKALQDAGKLEIFTDLSKAQYYSILKQSKVQFNCGLQDWVSFTLLEALAHNCLPCYPAHRDFSHVFRGAPEFLYMPESLDSACSTIETLLSLGATDGGKQYLKETQRFHDGTLERIANIIKHDSR